MRSIPREKMQMANPEISIPYKLKSKTVGRVGIGYASLKIPRGRRVWIWQLLLWGREITWKVSVG